MWRPLRRNRGTTALVLAIGALVCATSASVALGHSHRRGHHSHDGGGTFAALSCGAQVTSSVTLTADIGPCPPSSDGIDIVASDVRVNLNGHSITGTNSTNNTTSEPVGIGLMNVHNVTVKGPGTIQAFDAGVAVNGGDNNTIKRLTVRNNVAHVLFSGGVDPANLEKTPCDYGDGVTTDNSNNNVIDHVVATGNGPFDGIALVDASNHNRILHSKSYNNNVPNIIQSGAAAGQNGPCGPFGANGPGPGRPHQDIGIRIEGPGATHNIVAGNKAIGNELEGISIHANVCPNNPAGVPPGAPNTNNLVADNQVLSNGFADNTDGIAVLSQGPAGVVCIAFDNAIVGNTSSYNARDGIFLGGRGSTGNFVLHNRANYNGNDGIELSGPTPPNPRLPNGLPGTINTVVRGNKAHGNGVYDGADGNPTCDNNTWRNNRFTTFNPSCVMGG